MIGRCNGATVALLAVLVASTGCSSFDRLRDDDRAVGEDEIHRAGGERDESDLGDHLRHIVEHRAEYRVDQVVAALAALGERADGRAVPAIAALGNDHDEEVRYHVAAALRRIGTPEAAAARQHLATTETSDIVRDELAASQRSR